MFHDPSLVRERGWADGAIHGAVELPRSVVLFLVGLQVRAPGRIQATAAVLVKLLCWPSFRFSPNNNTPGNQNCEQRHRSCKAPRRDIWEDRGWDWRHSELGAGKEWEGQTAGSGRGEKTLGGKLQNGGSIRRELSSAESSVAYASSLELSIARLLVERPR